VKLWTCSRCNQIGSHEDELDGKHICHRCLHKARHGEDVYERCELRGFHQTDCVGGGMGYQKRTDGYYFSFRIDCLCGCRVQADLRSAGPEEGAEGFAAFLIPAPMPARWWALVEGEYTPLSDEDVAIGNVPGADERALKHIREIGR
jgi:hypothetical protein